jgi:hypothetical protein
MITPNTPEQIKERILHSLTTQKDSVSRTQLILLTGLHYYQILSGLDMLLKENKVIESRRKSFRYYSIK